VKRRFAISLMMLFLAASSLAQDAAHGQNWQLEPPEQRTPAARFASPFASIFADEPLGFSRPSPLVDRPRLSVSLPPRPTMLPNDNTPTLSWSLNAWEMNTASLAHIQCSRATRTIESFLIEDCRFVDQPLPDDSGSLVQVQGQWVAAPGLTVGAGAYAGRQSTLAGIEQQAAFAGLGANNLPNSLTENIQGINMNVSFGLSMGQVGSLLLDLQVERYRQTPEPFSLSRGLTNSPFENEPAVAGHPTRYGSAGQLGVAWRGNKFGADLSGQYQELPYWTGEQLEGEGFRSFDLEFSWRAPTHSSISVGVSNLLDQLPGAANTAEQGVEEAVDGIYGRIPYVRYKHDL